VNSLTLLSHSLVVLFLYINDFAALLLSLEYYTRNSHRKIRDHAPITICYHEPTMTDVLASKGRSPLAEATNRVNSPFPTTDGQSNKPPVEPLTGHPPNPAARSQHATQSTRSGMAPTTTQTETVATNARVSAVLRPPTENDDAKRLSQASYASTSSSRSKKNYKTHIGPWQLGKTLGKGSSARVRLCRHAMTNQLAAVKIVNRRMAYLVQDSSLAALSKYDSSLPENGNGEMRVPMAIEREVAILKLIEHPNIMKLYDIWENRSEM
jgi:serine/threonine-protein kinase HSL1 (negative regulator of Swe1 kinase)